MAEKLTSAAVKPGHLVPVRNLQRKKLKSNHLLGAPSYVAVWVEHPDGTEECLLLTPHQIKVASARAKKNPEDVPAKGWLQDLLD